MTRVANHFIDPGGALGDYAWPINHDTEEAFGQVRKIDHASNTRSTGLVRQQADESPFTMKIAGTLLTKAQYAKFNEFYAACKTRTIIFQDFTGEQMEVTILSLQPLRKRTLRNPRDPTNAPLWYWTYTMEMEVISFVSGLHADAGVTP